MFVILPFEKEFYKKNNYDVDYLGHPLIDQLKKYEEKPDFEKFINKYNLPNIPVIALMPGSRNQEIEKILPVMLETAKSFPKYQFVICGTTSIKTSVYENYLQGSSTKIIFNKNYEILLNSTAALVKSGTSTLETALLDIPQVVCYKTSRLTYFIAKLLVKIKYISLVNLIMDKQVVCELIQNQCNPTEMIIELNKILPNTEDRNQLLSDYKKLHEILGDGKASEKIASLMFSYLNK
jgi:lipid-A-disaccharide synthase